MASEKLLKDLRAAFELARDLDGSLNERLESYSAAIRRLHPAYARAVDELVARLASSAAGDAAPQPGERMPGFVLPNESGHLVSLESLLSTGPVAVLFHRGHWCPWCRISWAALARAHRELAEVKGRIVAVMPEREQFATVFKTEARSPFPVLTDLDNGYALLLNLAIWVGPDLQYLLTDLHRNLPDYQGNDSWMLPIPAVFVIDGDGRVRDRFLDPDFRKRVEIDQLMAALCRAGRANE